MTTQEAFNTHRRAVGALVAIAVSSALSKLELRVSRWRAVDQTLREVMLKAHVDACGVVIDTGDGNSYCGEDGYYCPKAEEIRRLGR